MDLNFMSSLVVDRNKFDGSALKMARTCREMFQILNKRHSTWLLKYLNLLGKTDGNHAVNKITVMYSIDQRTGKAINFSHNRRLSAAIGYGNELMYRVSKKMCFEHSRWTIFEFPSLARMFRFSLFSETSCWRNLTRVSISIFFPRTCAYIQFPSC